MPLHDTTLKTAITLCGSLRKGSINEVLRQHMSGKLREAGVAVTDLDLADFEMPIFNEDLEAEQRPKRPSGSPSCSARTTSSSSSRPNTMAASRR